MNPEFIRWKSISNRINGFHTHPCNNGHAKIQTADHADRALFAGEFQLLQLARLTNSFMTYQTSILTWPKFPTQWLPISHLPRFKNLLIKLDFSLRQFLWLSCEDPGDHLLRSHSTFLTSKSESRPTQITSCRVGLICMSFRNLTPWFCFAR